MHVERYGHGGAAVLLVHGFGTCSFLWRDIAPEFALANRTAFAVDLFGYGESDRPFDADFSIAAQAEYLDRALTVIHIQRGLKPWRFAPVRAKATSVLELPCRTADETGTVVGDKIEISIAERTTETQTEKDGKVPPS